MHLRGVAGVPQRMCIVGYLVSALMGERFSMFEAFVRRGHWSIRPWFLPLASSARVAPSQSVVLASRRKISDHDYIATTPTNRTLSSIALP